MIIKIDLIKTNADVIILIFLCSITMYYFYNLFTDTKVKKGLKKCYNKVIDNEKINIEEINDIDIDNNDCDNDNDNDDNNDYNDKKNN